MSQTIRWQGQGLLDDLPARRTVLEDAFLQTGYLDEAIEVQVAEILKDLKIATIKEIFIFSCIQKKENNFFVCFLQTWSQL